jgi:hypothetical protein
MSSARIARQSSRPRALTKIAQRIVGGIWLAGSAWNVLVTRRMDDPYGWLAQDSWVPAWRWLFGDVVSASPDGWTLALAAGEAMLGILTLRGGEWGRRGLLGGALFSTALFSLGTPYTLMMGPYALRLLWLARRDQIGPVRPTLRHAQPSSEPIRR